MDISEKRAFMLNALKCTSNIEDKKIIVIKILESFRDVYSRHDIKVNDNNASTTMPLSEGEEFLFKEMNFYIDSLKSDMA